MVDPGIYREAVSINPVSNQTAVPLTVQAAITGTAIVAWSDILTNWSTDPGYPSAYTTIFSPDKSTCSLPTGSPEQLRSHRVTHRDDLRERNAPHPSRNLRADAARDFL